MQVSMRWLLWGFIITTAYADPPSCTECTSLDCRLDEDQGCRFILDNLHRQAGKFMEIYRHRHPVCPKAMDEEGWDDLEETFSECEEHRNLKLGCALLKYRVLQNCKDDLQDATYIGQITGCPRVEFFRVYETLEANTKHCAFSSERKVRANCTIEFSLAICREAMCFTNFCWNANTTKHFQQIEFPRNGGSVSNYQIFDMMSFNTIVVLAVFLFCIQ